MATSVTRLRDAIISVISSSGVVKDAGKLQDISEGLATAIVNEIQNGTVTVTGVATGPGSASGTIS